MKRSPTLHELGADLKFWTRSCLRGLQEKSARLHVKTFIYIYIYLEAKRKVDHMWWWYPIYKMLPAGNWTVLKFCSKKSVSGGNLMHDMRLRALLRNSRSSGKTCCEGGFEKKFTPSCCWNTPLNLSPPASARRPRMINSPFVFRVSCFVFRVSSFPRVKVKDTIFFEVRERGRERERKFFSRALRFLIVE